MIILLQSLPVLLSYSQQAKVLNKSDPPVAKIYVNINSTVQITTSQEFF